MPSNCSAFVLGVDWNDIPDFPGYRADRFGYVWSCRKRVCVGKGESGPRSRKFAGSESGNWKRLKRGCHSYGYATVCVGRDGRFVPKTVHSLVCRAFHGRPTQGFVCRHLDGNPTNNNPTNLCWGTSKDNTQDSIRHGTCEFIKTQHGETHNRAKISDVDTLLIRYMGAIGKRRNPSIALLFDIQPCTVSRILNNKRRTRRGGAPSQAF